ncbi:protein kinase [Gammaproteobacteria bacterium]|nr:protein kinase [Gammaproteobacteria bacterium]
MSKLQGNTPVIQIPGFEFIKLISESPRSHVWSCRQTQSSRALAAKIFDVSGLIADGFSDRDFLRLFGQADFPKDVCPRVLACDRVGDYYYQVFDFIDGQTLDALLYEGLSIVAFGELVVRVAKGLNQLHVHDIFHGDLNPKNIMLDNAGNVFLIDLSPDFRGFETPSGSLLKIFQHSKLPYMSPELIEAGEASAQSDLFSLSAVMYEVLTGELPYTQGVFETSESPNLVISLPRLPEQFRHFRGLLEKGLQAISGDRYESALEFSDAVELIDHEDFEREIRIKKKPISAEELDLAGASLFDATGMDSGRGNPVTKSNSVQRMRWFASITGAVLLAAFLWAGFFKIELLPREIAQFFTWSGSSEIAEARNEAQSLREDPNQGLSTIMAAYNRLMALAPEDQSVSQQIEEVRGDWVESIKEALDQGDYSFAESRLDEAEAVLVQMPELNELSIQLQNWKRAESLYEVSRAKSQGVIEDHATRMSSLIVSYQNVLRLAPSHQGALVELKLIAAEFTRLAKEAFAVRDLTGTISYLERAQAADASIQDLEDVRDLLSQAVELRTTIRAILDEARLYRSMDQLVEPAGGNAAELYNRVLVVEPKNAIAKQAIDELASRILAEASRFLELGDLFRAENLLEQASLAGIDEGLLAGLSKQIDAEKERIGQIARYLNSARDLMKKGYITTPVTENAVAKLRAVQSIDPNNKEAFDLLGTCADILMKVAKDAHNYGFPEDAFDYLDLAIAINPRESSWSELRAEWSK